MKSEYLSTLDQKINTELSITKSPLIDTHIICEIVKRRFSHMNKPVAQYNDILVDSDITNSMTMRTSKWKYVQQIIGHIWQDIIGIRLDWMNLKHGHSSGLDLMTKSTSGKKYIMELKNRYNTCNGDSLITMYNKLSRFQANNPEYELIHGQNSGQDRMICHNGVNCQV